MTEVVGAGYDAVYAAWRSSATFHDMWARNAVDGSAESAFDHLNFADLDALARLRDTLALQSGDRLINLAGSAGGPGARIARETKTHPVGVDLSRVGMRSAAERARTRWTPTLEMSLTLQIEPYPRPVFAVAHSR